MRSPNGVILLAALFPRITDAMPLRAFAALPLETGGTVVQVMTTRTPETDDTQLAVSAAYGVAARHTLMLGAPYRLEPGGPDRWGDMDVLYRYTAWQIDEAEGTRRLGVLTGAAIPLDDQGSASPQAGLVGTWFQGRQEWDASGLYRADNGAPDSARLDLAWQYRLLPRSRADWGLGSEWYGILEWGTRWQEHQNAQQQVTVGLQWLNARWVVEGGVTQDLNGPDDTHWSIGARAHF